MAGKRQHYIPQALMRGFVTTSGSLYMFRRGKDNHIVVSPQKVGVERYFYGPEGCIEDVILTDIESKHAGILRSLQSGVLPGSVIDLCGFITTCIVRTKAFRTSCRDILCEITESIFDGIANLTHGDMVCNLFLNNFDNVVVMFDGLAVSNGIELYSAEYYKILKKFCFLIIHKSEEISQYYGHNIVETLSSLRSGFYGAVANAGFNVQSKLIHKMKEMEKGLVKTLSNLQWTIYRSENGIVLGDSIVVMIDNDMKPYGYVNGEDIACVLFPICSRSYLIGASNSVSKIDSVTFNTLVASVCTDFYIGNSCDLNMYTGCIASALYFKGTDSHALNGIVTSAIQELFPFRGSR